MAWRWPMRTMMGMRTGRDAGPTRAPASALMIKFKLQRTFSSRYDWYSSHEEKPSSPPQHPEVRRVARRRSTWTPAPFQSSPGAPQVAAGLHAESPGRAVRRRRPREQRSQILAATTPVYNARLELPVRHSSVLPRRASS